MVTLRDYQIECIKKINNMTQNEKKIVQIATGGGKTIILSELARQTKGRVLIVVMSTELRKQTIDKLHMVCGNNISVGSVQGNLKEYNNNIIVATRQTLTSKNFEINKLIETGSFETIMFDECHIAIKQQINIVKLLGMNSKVIGFTATPYNKDLYTLYSGFVYQKDLISMIEDKYLVEPLCYQIKTDINLNEVKVRNGDFEIGSLSEKINNDVRNNLILKAYRDKCKDRDKTLIFATDVKHSKAIASYFMKNGIKAVSIDGSLNKKEREKIFNDFETGEIKVLVNVEICTTGLDIPAIDSIIFARPTKSKSLYIQMLGRGLRLSNKKSNCLVIDIVDFITKHDLVNSETIFNMKNGETLIQAKEKNTKTINNFKSPAESFVFTYKNENEIDMLYEKVNIIENKENKEFVKNENNKKNENMKKNDNKFVSFMKKLFK